MLHQDITEQEFHDVMARCGIVAEDADGVQEKIGSLLRSIFPSRPYVALTSCLSLWPLFSSFYYLFICLFIHLFISGNKKIKLYRTPNGDLKGDGRCCYLKTASVSLALQVLDGSEIRGHTIHVERVSKS